MNAPHRHTRPEQARPEHVRPAHARALDDADAALRDVCAFMRDALSAAAVDPDADVLEERWSGWVAQMRAAAAALAADRRTRRIHPADAGESALVEVVLGVMAEHTLTAMAADVRRDLAPGDPAIERWVVGTGAGVRVFECLLAADTSPTRTVGFIEQIAELHPHPLVRAHARYLVATDALALGERTDDEHVALVAEIADRVYAGFPDERARALAAIDPRSIGA